MRYLGGKQRIAKYIVDILHTSNKRVFFEPFVGGMSIIPRLDPNRFSYFVANDILPELCAMYKALQEGWIPPERVTEDEYKRAKDGEGLPHVRAFIGLAGSWGGKWWGGYARDPSRGTNYFKYGKNTLLKLAKNPNFVKTKFESRSYLSYTPKNCLVYCDPPYEGTTKYKGVPPFDKQVFIEWCKSARGNGCDVFVSEYSMPFECISEIETKTGLGDSNNAKIPRIERVYKV